MAKLTISAKPTFKVKVDIPHAGEKFRAVEFEFNHFKLSEYESLIKKSREENKLTDFLLKITAGWEYEEELNAENIELLLETFGGSDIAIIDAYTKEIRGIKEKN